MGNNGFIITHYVPGQLADGVAVPRRRRTFGDLHVGFSPCLAHRWQTLRRIRTVTVAATAGHGGVPLY